MERLRHYQNMIRSTSSFPIFAREAKSSLPSCKVAFGSVHQGLSERRSSIVPQPIRSVVILDTRKIWHIEQSCLLRIICAQTRLWMSDNVSNQQLCVVLNALGIWIIVHFSSFSFFDLAKAVPVERPAAPPATRSKGPVKIGALGEMDTTERVSETTVDPSRE